MSDYISKSAVVEELKKQKDDNDISCRLCMDTMIEIVEEQPTLSETEIIRKTFERVVDKLCDLQPFLTADGQYVSLYEVVQTIKKECGINE